MIALLLLVVFVVVCKSIDTTSISLLNTDISINERNLNLNTHHELAPLYDRGDPRVIRRKLTRSPSRKSPTPSKPSKPTNTKPSRRMKPTSKPTRRPTRRPSRRPIQNPTSSNSIIPVGTILRVDVDTVHVINSSSQYIAYTANGTCTSLPYYLISENVLYNAFTSLLLSKKGDKITSIDMSNNRTSTFTILNYNPYASNKCAKTTIVSFKKGDIYQLDNESPSYWYTFTLFLIGILLLILLSLLGYLIQHRHLLLSRDSIVKDVK